MSPPVDQGWQPRRCAHCGHASGEHKSSGARGFTSGPRYGVCLHAECPCREFVEPGQLEGGDVKGAA